ncbi:hypothetical protein BDQ12DRAFT_668689 [Crucibulum laeve]|uniref:Uncharacterized protein n=1 Tax=Crucibulum laeve TaxID=68775 RepID=A0A5C3M2W6_9AGAR|nr:hypothetical protein BDQ12DRAFT_668689 [Crucibulum laeve]
MCKALEKKEGVILDDEEDEYYELEDDELIPPYGWPSSPGRVFPVQQQYATEAQEAGKVTWVAFGGGGCHFGVVWTYLASYAFLVDYMHASIVWLYPRVLCVASRLYACQERATYSLDMAIMMAAVADALQQWTWIPE